MSYDLQYMRSEFRVLFSRFVWAPASGLGSLESHILVYPRHDVIPVLRILWRLHFLGPRVRTVRESDTCLTASDLGPFMLGPFHKHDFV